MHSFIHHQVSAAAERFPEQIALWSEDRSLSYAELERLSDSLSQWLTQRLPGTGHRIALVVPKSCEAIITILGILKSGNAYAPLGDNWSAGRLQKICHVGQFSLLITDQKDRGLEYDVSKQLAYGSEQWVEALNQPLNEQPSPPAIHSEDIAYILFTSGSTGIPKGVCVSHRAAAYFPLWAKDEFSIQHTDRIASVSPMTFDLSTFDFFTTLSSGGTLYLVPEKLKVFPARFSEFLQNHGITCLYAVPSTLILLTQRGKLDKRDLSSLKTVLFAGEEFPVPLFQTLRQALPHSVQYCNLYGPTETNVCTYFRVPNNFDDPVFPIGVGLPATHIFLRNTQENTHNGTVTGELCVAGPTVMSGYFGKENEDAEYWLKDPQAIETRAFATGDQASKDEEGNWAYHGRLDKMVKIWGYRVELGEIESCLMELPDTEQAIVVKKAGKKSGERDSESTLVAFILLKTTDSPPYTHNNNHGAASLQSDDENEFKVKAIREAITHCKHNLPAYMVPKNIIFLTEIPINATGKVDRLRLEKIASEA